MSAFLLRPRAGKLVEWTPVHAAAAFVLRHGIELMPFAHGELEKAKSP